MVFLLMYWKGWTYAIYKGVGWVRNPWETLTALAKYLPSTIRFGKHVYKIICYMYLFHSNVSCSNSTSNIVVLDANMLGFGVISIILDEMDSTFSMWEYRSDSLWNTKLCKRTFQSSSFLHCFSYINVFCVSSNAIGCRDSFQDITLVHRMKI